MEKISLTSPVIRKGDTVQIIAGRERGKTGKVTSVLRESGRIVIERLNMVKRATKPSQKNPQGGMVEKEAPLSYSNVLLFCSKCNKGVRVKTKVSKTDKVRVCKKCDGQI